MRGTTGNSRSNDNNGRILVSKSSDGVPNFSYPGDADYEKNLEEYNRQNNIPPDNNITPPVNNSSDLDDIIPPSDTSNQDNIDQELTVKELLEIAKESYKF